MKKHINIITLILMITISQSFSKMIWQNISAENRDVHLIDSLNYYIVGDDGKILRSFDSGKKWVWQESYFRGNLLSIYFIDINKGVIVGDSGYVLTTSNSGKTWKNQKVSKEKFFAVKMIDYNSIIVAGEKGVIYKSSDFGNQWEIVYKNDSTDLKRLKFIDETTGYAVGDNNFVLKTENGGKDWKNLFPYRKNFMLASVDFFDISHGVIGGFDSLTARPLTFTTTDGGQNWDSVKFDFWSNWVGIKMYSRTNILLFSSHGGITKTDDFFTTFKNDFPTTKDYINIWPQPVWMKSVSTNNNSTVYCIGMFNTSLISFDYGQNFKVINRFDMTSVPRSLFMSGMAFINNNECLFYGETGHVFKSIDEGTTWDYIYPKDSTKYYLFFGNSTLFAHHFKSINEGFLSGKRQRQSDGHYSFTIDTKDGGKSWIAKDRIISHSMSFLTKDIGYSVTDSVFSKTTDGGETWSSKTIFSKNFQMNFWEVDFKTKDVGFIYGRQGKYFTDDTINYPNRNAYRVLKTTDGGDSFDTIATIGNSRIYVKNVYFKDDLNGFIFGTGYDMLVTDDGGKNWNWLKIDTNLRKLLSMKFLNDKFGIAGSIQDTIFLTSDGGKSWWHEKMPTKSGYDTISSFDHIAVKNIDTVFLFGYNKLVRGVNVPDSLNNISIEENKFNPFFFITILPNPTSGFVNFKLYGLYSVKDSPLNFQILNIYGNEVMDFSQLANNNNDGITSEFYCNIATLPLGVYIVKLSSQGYVYVKKMIKN